VFFTPVTFGGYSSVLKRALDHIIPTLVPFLVAEGDDTRHPLRYDHRRDLPLSASCRRARREVRRRRRSAGWWNATR